MVLTGGGDCPGLNAVIRGIVKRASQEKDWEVIGCIESFNGVLREPTEIVELNEKAVEGLQIQGGTILGTTNKGGPFAWPVRQQDGTWTTVDRSDEMIRKLRYMGVDAVINIGGDGSQRISLGLAQKGLNIVGVPKTIDNDLSSTDYTFGFQTAVQICTEAIDKLVTTAASHNRVFIMEVMGRDAGFLAQNCAIACGAEAAIVPEEVTDVDQLAQFMGRGIRKSKKSCIVIVSESPKCGALYYADRVKNEFPEFDVRVSILGHLQRGGTPSARDRILASITGVGAIEAIKQGQRNIMVGVRNNDVVYVPFSECIRTDKRFDKRLITVLDELSI